jgi:hypothetical protein
VGVAVEVIIPFRYCGAMLLSVPDTVTSEVAIHGRVV